MQTNHPTTTFYFAFAHTYCKLQVYKTQETFARKILDFHQVEFLTESSSKSWQDIDTRVLLDLVGNALPKLITLALPQPTSIAQSVAKQIGVSPTHV